MVKEFKEFISKGNLIDIAVGFVMGVAFASVVTTFVNRIVNPLIGLVFDVSSLDSLWAFGNIDEATGLPAGSVGAFLGAVLNFVIISLVLFLVVRAYNRMRAAKEDEGPSEEVQLLREIRDSLAGRA
ncbi:MAG TPA: large conductance mechanosensitive channel protein MscL [Acidimicrobiia bacterium]|jgi:large conductance mechanosensitive channel